MKTLHDVVTVPTAAIQRGAPGAYVYLVNADNTVSVRPMKLGPSDGPTAAVTSGLAAGERVVIDGTDRLRDGAHVIVPGAPGAGAPPGAHAQGSGPNAGGQNAGHGTNRKSGGQ